MGTQHKPAGTAAASAPLPVTPAGRDGAPGGTDTQAAGPAGMREAKFRIGEVVRHKHFPFRGVVFDVDPTFDNTEEWWLSIPEEIRPAKDQPYYHLFAEHAESEYVAYVSEQNRERDLSDEPGRHPRVMEELSADGAGGWRVRAEQLN